MAYAIGSGGRAGVMTKGSQARKGTPPFQRTKSISYKSGNSDQIYSVGDTTSATGSSGSIPSAVVVQNTGVVPLLVMVGYTTYSDGTTIASSGDARYIHYMVMPGETLNPPVRAVIMTANDDNVTQFTGTVVENTAPSSNMYADISTVSSGFDNTTDPVTIASADGDFWRVGDMMRSNAEVVEITAIDGANLTVKRAMLGTSAASHGDGETLRLQFSNDYHDVGKYSVAQTDSQGRFKCTNFFGLGRAATSLQGIVPGSVAIKFYQPGYQELGLTGITSSTNTGISASSQLKLDITVDGGTLFQDLTFTTDSSNANFGGTNGLISKIQDALSSQFYTAGNLFEKKVTVGIVGGDIRFTSGSNLSTSAILLADTGDSGSFLDAAANGRIPAVGNIDAAVAARLPDDVSYDNVTYSASPTNVFGFDDGNGRLTGMCSGTINYETGALNMTGCPVDAEFVYSVAHTSAFSGKLSTSSTTKGGSLMDICVNTPSQKREGSVSLKVY